MKIGYDRNENKINAVEITNDTLSNRGGLSFMLRYINTAGISTMIADRFGHLRKSCKGETISECCRQIIAFCMDGTQHSIAWLGSRVYRSPGMRYKVAHEHIIGNKVFQEIQRYRLFVIPGTTERAFHPASQAGYAISDQTVSRYHGTVQDSNDAVKREGCNPT